MSVSDVSSSSINEEISVSITKSIPAITGNGSVQSPVTVNNSGNHLAVLS